MLVKKQINNKIIYSILSIFLVFLLASCSKKLVFQKSDVVPAAVGKAKVKKDDNNNYHIAIKIRNLASPNRLTPPRKYYIVWMESKRKGLKNLGQIKTTSGLFTSGLKATFSTTSPTKPERIFITAEDQLNAIYPGNELVLTTKSF